MGAAYDIVLVVHVALASVALGSVVATGVVARVARRQATPGPPVLRYFRPGTNWAERVLVVVPVPGYALVAMSEGAISLGQAWVVTGTLLWAASLAAAMVWTWPAEEALQRELSSTGGRGSTAVALRARRLVRASALTAALLVAAFVVMAAQPGGNR